jgi:hypothetical protein
VAVFGFLAGGSALGRHIAIETTKRSYGARNHAACSRGNRCCQFTLLPCSQCRWGAFEVRPMEAEENKGVTQAVPPLALLAAIVAAGTLTLGWITLLLWLILKALSLM